MRLRATLVVEYNADPKDYLGATDAAEMALIDATNWEEDPMALVAAFEDDEFQVTVEPVGEVAA